MKKERKKESLLYEDLGFPIYIKNCPMKKVFGKWMLDINLADLQLNVLSHLAHKNTALSKDELRFIRKYFEMTTTEFGKIFSVTHPAVLKWESGKSRPNPTTELFIRFFILEQLHFKDKEIVKLYHGLRPYDLAHAKISDKPLIILGDHLESA
jgi:DNA-binding transcriptional regulator YiaG